MRIVNLITLLFVIAISMQLVAAEDTGTIGPFTQFDEGLIYKVCSNCTFNNITSIIYQPTGEIILSNVGMSQSGTLYTYLLNASNTTRLGNYVSTGFGNPDGITTAWERTFEVTPTGQERINSGEGISIGVSILVLIVAAAICLVMGFFFKNPAYKIILIGTSVIFFVAATLYTVVILTQVVGSFSAIIDGFSTFWFVVKIFLMILVIALLVFTLFAIWMFWMKKRGKLD